MPRREKKPKEESIDIEPKCRSDFKALIFNPPESRESFHPQAIEPLPKPLRLRHQAQWWVRCISDELIPYRLCHESFVDHNALYRKNHPCWNCPLGKSYRRIMAEDNFEDERFETFNKLGQ